MEWMCPSAIDCSMRQRLIVVRNLFLHEIVKPEQSARGTLSIYIFVDLPHMSNHFTGYLSAIRS